MKGAHVGVDDVERGTTVACARAHDIVHPDHTAENKKRLLVAVGSW